MKKVAILGYGTVGSGVFEVIEMNKQKIEAKLAEKLVVKYVLDRKKLTGTKVENLVTDNFEQILQDDEVDVFVETLGGISPAFEFSKRALEKGKVVVSSNKELVEKHGALLMQVAKDNGGKYLFEASVGGGIPIIKPLSVCLSANEITSIMGIVNGTTNYILTMMDKESMSFEDALISAKRLGYAEQDPTADVEGHDSGRKIAIMTSIATMKNCDYDDIYVEGIQYVTKNAMEFAKSIGKTIKLVARMSVKKGEVSVIVSPFLVDKDDKLSFINDVFNGVVVNGNAVGETLFYGQGAGKLPTASAVVGDIVDSLISFNYVPMWSDEKLEIVKKDDMKVKALVVFKADKNNIVKVREKLDKPFLENDGFAAFYTDVMKEVELKTLLDDIDIDIESVIRTR